MLRLKAAMFLAAVIPLCSAAPQSGSGRWDSLGPAPIARAGACAVRLPDGRLFFAGGGPPGAARATEIIDAAGERAAAAPLAVGHARHSCAPLPGGRVLVAGGSDATRVLDGADLYDAGRNEWVAANRMTTARMGHTATALADGRVLIAGGENENGVLNTLEIFDPATGVFTPAGAMNTARRDHAAALLADGRVLIAGGANATGALGSMEILAPESGVSTFAAGLRTARAGLSATVLGDGSVLLAGGTNGLSTLATAELYHAATGQVTDAAPMTQARSGQLAFALPEGDVLLLGGDGVASTAERFQVATVANAATAQAPGTQLPVTAAAQGTVVRMAPGTGSGTLDQCANGVSPAPGVIGLTCVSWVNGNLNSSRASYREGDAVPYRLRMTGMPVGQPATVVIEWDTTQSGKHALDYLTRFNAAVTGADPCAGNVCSGTPATATIVRDSAITEGGEQPLTMRAGRLAPYLAQLTTQFFSLWGGGSMSVGPISTAGSYASSSSASVAITFTPTIENPVLAWGGHIATRIDWGEASSAVSINGSPFHMRLSSVNGSGGNQDRALSNDAAAFPATIVITKATSKPAAAGDFTFTSSPGLPAGAGVPAVTSFALPYLLGDGTTLAYTRTFDQIFIASGTQSFVITESAMPANWTLQSLQCNKIAGTGSVSTSGNAATVNAQEGDTFACTFTNAAPVTVTLQKSCVPSTDDGTFTFTINGVDSGPIGCASPATTTFSRALAVGATINVSESGATLGNYTTTLSCDTTPAATGTTSASFTMPNGSVTCTVTNTRKKQNVTLNKSCKIAGDPGNFTLGINADTEVKACGGSLVREVYVGTQVAVSEAAAAGTDLTKYVSSISCPTVSLGGSGLNRTFQMPDAPVTCTVTNTAPVQVTMTKSCTPDTDDGTFTFAINGANSGTIGCKAPATTTFSQIIKVGETVNLSETGTTLSNYTSSINCGTAGSATGTSLQFTMPEGAVNCTVSNVRKKHNVTLNKVCTIEGDTGNFTLGVNTDTEVKSCGGSVTREVYVGTQVAVSETAAAGTDLTKYVSNISCPTVTLGGSGLNRTFQMPDAPVACTVTNTAPVQVTMTKSCTPDTDDGAFTFSINGASSGTIGCKAPATTSYSQIIKVGDPVNLVESGSTLSNYTTTINCGTAGSASGTSLQFNMPQSAVNCTVSNVRKSFAVTLNKVCAPANDSGRFLLSIDGVSEEKGCGGSVTRQAYVGKTVKVTEAGAGSTDLTKYVSDIACPSVTLGGSGLNREFTMPESAVTCTVTNRRPAVTITKECKAGLTPALAVTVASSGKVCNTGGILLTNLLLTDTQTGAPNNVTGTVNFSTADLGIGECRDFTTTFAPTAASTGSCSPSDTTCSLAFTDLVTIKAKGGDVEVLDSKSADCKLCKP